MDYRITYIHHTLCPSEEKNSKAIPTEEKGTMEEVLVVAILLIYLSSLL
jgi:hypothetical protein